MPCGTSSPPKASNSAGRNSRKVIIISRKLASCWASASSPPSCSAGPQQFLEAQALDDQLIVQYEGQLVLPRQGQLGDLLAGFHMLLDLVAGQVLALAAHHTAVFVGVTQFAFVQHEEVVRAF